MSNLTKRAITESFIRLLNQYPFDKITIKDIVEDCGVNRNTFYYHYHDIYELLEEVLRAETEKGIEVPEDYDSWQEQFLNAASFALQNKKAIYHIYNSVNRKQVDQYLDKVTGRVMLNYISRKAEGKEIAKEDLQYMADFYKHAIVGMILQWLDGNMKQDADILIRKMASLITGTGEVMLTNAEQMKK